jgi:hypothetical protein
MRIDIHLIKNRAMPQFISWVVNSIGVNFEHTRFYMNDDDYPPRFCMWLKQLRSQKRKMSPLIQGLLEEYYWKKVEYKRKQRSGEPIESGDIPEFEGMVFSHFVLALLLKHYNESAAERVRMRAAILEENRVAEEKRMMNLWVPSLTNELDEL